MGKEVTRLAHRAYHVDHRRRPARPRHRQNLVVRLVQRRPDQVVHRRIDDHKRLHAVAFHLQHPRQQPACLRHHEASRLQQQVRVQPSRRLVHRGGVVLHLARRIELRLLRRIAVVDAQAAARVHVANVVPIFSQLADQPRNPRQCRGKRLNGAYLRADMHAHSGRIQPPPPHRLAVDRPRQPDLDAELVLAQAGRNIRMRFRKNIGIHPQREPRAHAQRLRPRRQQRQLSLRLHVEQQDSRLQRRVNLPGLLAYAGEDHSLQRLFARPPHPLQFAPADDVEARAKLRQQPQDRQRRVRLHRVADRRRPSRKGLLEQPKPLPDLSGGVNIQRRSILLRQRVQPHSIAAERAPAGLEWP